MLHYSPRDAGLAYLPNTIIIALLSLSVVPRLIHRFSRLSLISVGLVLTCAGLAGFALVPVHAHYVVWILPATLLVVFGTGFVFTPTVGLALANVASTEAGIASGLTNVATQMGGSIGVALVATLSASWTAHQLDRHVGNQAALASGFHLGFVVLAMAPVLALLATVSYKVRHPATPGVELTPESALMEMTDIGMIDP